MGTLPTLLRSRTCPLSFYLSSRSISSLTLSSGYLSTKIARSLSRPSKLPKLCTIRLMRMSLLLSRLIRKTLLKPKLIWITKIREKRSILREESRKNKMMKTKDMPQEMFLILQWFTNQQILQCKRRKGRKAGKKNSGASQSEEVNLSRHPRGRLIRTRIVPRYLKK